MTHYRYEPGSWHRSETEDQVRRADLAYFADHPDISEFARRAVPGEFDPRRALTPEIARAWDQAEWVLVRAVGANGSSVRRQRTPLMPFGVSTVD